MSAKFYPKATDSLAWNKPNTARPSGATTQKLLGTLDIHSLDCLNGILLPKLFRPTGRKKNVLVIEKNFEITRTIYSNSERSEQFLVTECFFNLFLEVSQI